MNNHFKLFSVGPVEMDPDILQVGSQQPPYFRTEEFSQINLGICRRIKKFTNTSEKSETVILTGSGTAAMEAAVINIFNKEDNVLIISGGSFGQRFVEICNIHGIRNTVIRLNQGETLKREHLDKYCGKGFTGLLINAHETSTGVYYDLPMVGEFCKKENLFFVVDAISTFLADPYYMDEWNIDVTIISSQKALAIPPGLSFLVLNSKAIKKIEDNNINSLYFDLRKYIKDMKRGQTPFTPAVGIILQLDARLKQIDNIGVENIIRHTKEIAEDFRSGIKQLQLPFIIPSENLSNALTPLKPVKDVNAYEIYIYLIKKYNIYVCPSGGELSKSLLRIGHIGNLSKKDNEYLLYSFNKMKEEGII